jgi:apolipoprotein N-acyltransferase
MLSVLSGLLFTLAFPYIGNLTPLVFLAWVPLLLVEDNIQKSNYRSGKVFIHSYITFFLFNIATTWWVWNASGGGASLAIILNSLFMALTFQAFHLTKKHVGSKEGYLSLIVYWIAYEYFHHNWEMSWTWLSMGNFFSIVPSWVQWYAYTGILGGALWILTVNLLIFRVIQNVYFRKETWRIQTPLIWMAGLFLFVPLAISLWSYFTYEEKHKPYEIVALQPNIDPYNEKFVADLQSQLDKLFVLAAKKVRPQTDLVLGPETAISVNFYEDELVKLPFFPYIQEHKKKMHNVPWLLGASTLRVYPEVRSRSSFPMQGTPNFVEYYNSSLYLPKDDHPSFIHKSKLVPGVEIVPFSNYFPVLEELAIQNGGTSTSLGFEFEPQVFEDNGLRLAPVVCYESVYGDWVAGQCRKGAQAICVITNDGWWGDTPGYKQHMSFSRLRAIENRRWVVRSANTGISCFINPRGDVVQQTEWWVPAVIRQEINLNDEMTVYTRYGDMLGRSLGFIALILLLYTFVKRFKKKYIR